MPAWVDLDHLTGSLHGYGGVIPPDQAADIRAAAALHHAALAPCAPDDARKVLMALRSATIMLPNEDEAEAKATFAMLRVHLSDVPIDILEAACRAYCNAPGRRFFPRSAGELRAFVDPLLRTRKIRAIRLLQLAAQAEEADAERQRLADDPCTPEAMARIKAEFLSAETDADADGAARRVVARVAAAA